MRLHSHRGSPEPHAATLRHADAATYDGHTTEVARFGRRRGHAPWWARRTPEITARLAERGAR